MPAIMTHDLFGQEAYEALLPICEMYTPDERDAFLLGNQGPDPLFYLALVPPLEEFRALGDRMHHEDPTSSILALRAAVDALADNDRGVGRAYLAGFLCHYLLDRAVHPLVFYWERGICRAGVPELDSSDHAIVHAEIERDLDEMVLFAKKGQTIETYIPYQQVLRARDKVLQVLGTVYYNSGMGPLADGDPSLERIFPVAVRCFRVAQTLFYSPTAKRRRLVARLERPLLHNRYSLAAAMSHRVRAEATSDFDNREHAPWRNPFTGEPCDASFWDLYEGALAQVTSAVSLVLGDACGEDAVRTLTGGLNFGGEPVA